MIRPEKIDGYVAPKKLSYSKDKIYKTFSEGIKPRKKEKFGNTIAYNQYKKYDETKLDKSDVCPTCKNTFIEKCHCIYSDKKCVNGHCWYVDRKTLKIRIGNPH